jgi:hypothetical protein
LFLEVDTLILKFVKIQRTYNNQNNFEKNLNILRNNTTISLTHIEELT